MARRWTTEEENKYRTELLDLYITQNKTISEIAVLQKISYQTVFDRLGRLNIQTCRDKKAGFNNIRSDIKLPSNRSSQLAELFGILLGDGCLTYFQVTVTLGSKEVGYAVHVRELLQTVFGGTPKICVRNSGKNIGHRDVYLGSTQVTKWLTQEGLVRNKVATQVDVPKWLFEKSEYMESFLRGFFDTDGSVYRLRFGMQISLTNKSMPLLFSLQKMLKTLGYSASAVSAYRVYLTKKSDIQQFFREIKPANAKHIRRYREMRRVGTQAVNEDAL